MANSIFASTSKGVRLHKYTQRQIAIAALGALTPLMASAQISSSDAQALLQRHNEVRAQVNSPALCMNQQLMQAAENHCQDMVRTNSFSHTGSNGSDPGVRIRATGYSPRTWGENIAWGQQNTAAVMNAWENSSGHYNNIIKAGFQEVGFARCGTNVWVVNFGAQGSGQTNCGAGTTTGTGQGTGQGTGTTPPQTTPSAADPGLAVYNACKAYTDGWHYFSGSNRYRLWWNNSCWQYNGSTKALSVMRQNADGNWRFYTVR